MTREEAIEELYRIVENQYRSAEKDKEALSMAIEALSAEPCEDCISRKDAINAIKRTVSTEQIKALKRLPSIQPKPKTGHWIEKDGFDGDTYYDCSECGESWTTIDGTPWNNGMKYCPNCGAKMESEEV